MESYAVMAGYGSIKQDKQDNILVEKISPEHILFYILFVIPRYIHSKTSFYIQVVISFHLFALRDIMEIMGYLRISKDIFLGRT
jgi:hypothetical protein